MRLVDIDNLELQEYEPQNDLAYAAGWNDCVDAIKVDIRDMPTIHAIPVEWINAYMNKAYGRVRAEIIREMLDVWMEQEG